jgi:hypothetical protein
MVLLFSFFLMLALTGTVFSVSAAEPGRVEGSVTDQSNAKVVGARVTLRDKAGVIQYETRTGEDGRFQS